MHATHREAPASTPRRTTTVRGILAAVLTVGLLATGWQPASGQGVPQTAVPFGAAGYRYQVVGHGAEPGFEAVGFDDAGWDVGASPFGTTAGPCELNNPDNIRTAWPPNTDLLVRRPFTLPAGAHSLRVFGTIDNDAVVFVNGHAIGSVQSGNCVLDGINFVAADDLLQPGTNLLAIRGHDQGVATYLDVLVTYDAPLYAVCALYDQSRARRSGSVVPIRFQLCDADGANLSDAAIVVHATGLRHVDGGASADVEDAGHANPDDDFRHDASLGGDGGYILNKSTKGLPQGTWELTFTVDGVEHDSYVLRFTIR